MTAAEPAPRTEGGAWLLLPLAGVRVSEPVQIGDAFVTMLSFVEWRLIERRMFTDEYEGYAMDDTSFPPFAVFEVPAEVDGEHAATALKLDREAFSIALRLAGQQSFVEPELLCLYFRSGQGSGRPDAGMNVRTAGPYRQAQYERRFRAEDIGPDIAARAEVLLPLVRRWLEVAHTIERTSLNLLRQSHLPFQRNNDRLLFLCGAVEAMLYSWRDRIGGSSLGRRAGLALALAGDAQHDLSTLHRLRRIRNELAHGQIDNDRYADVVAPLQRLVAALVVVWMRFCVATVREASGGTLRQIFNEQLADCLRSPDPVARARALLFGTRE
jgi:hypothetical protein